jgi:mono/diheme cytochrome c family protein
VPSLPRHALAALFALAASACTSAVGEHPSTSVPVDTSDSHPSYAEDVAPILMKSCASCHQPGGIAPFSLLTYEDARDAAGAIKAKTATREMPPFNPDNSGDCNTFEDARWLSEEEIATLADWVDAGAPEGDPAKAPAPPEPPAALQGKTTTLDMGVTYLPDQTRDDDYRCFIVDPALDHDRFLTAFEVKPGDQRVVHHLILFTLDSDAAEKQAADLDQADGKDGYQCFGGPGVIDSRFVVGWAPGGGPTYYAEDTGIRLYGKRKLVMQVHYNLANGAHPDRTTVDLALTDSVAKEATITRVAAKNINLPPGMARVEAKGTFKVPAAAGEVTVWGVAPHMHTRGTTMDVTATSGGKTSCMVKVPRWNFHWQSFNRYTTPLTLAGGSQVSITCGYDTSKETKTITSGEGTENEMCINFLYVTR